MVGGMENKVSGVIQGRCPVFTVQTAQGCEYP